jgi:hypothetical protein
LLERFGIKAASGYCVEMKFLSLAVGAAIIEQGVSTYVFAAARAVIGTGAGEQLVPAIFAQAIISLADGRFAVKTNCRPEQLIYALQSKLQALF